MPARDPQISADRLQLIDEALNPPVGRIVRRVGTAAVELIRDGLQ